MATAVIGRVLVVSRRENYRSQSHRMHFTPCSRACFAFPHLPSLGSPLVAPVLSHYIHQNATNRYCRNYRCTAADFMDICTRYSIHYTAFTAVQPGQRYIGGHVHQHVPSSQSFRHEQHDHARNQRVIDKLLKPTQQLQTFTSTPVLPSACRITPVTHGSLPFANKIEERPCGARRLTTTLKIPTTPDAATSFH